MKKYSIGKSRIHGKGIILSKDVKKNEAIFVFKGKDIYYSGGIWWKEPDSLQVGYIHWIKPLAGSPGAYLNHSCNPTAGIRGNRIIVAMQPLKKCKDPQS